ncbi:MAG: ChaN family lipoprotein [Spirochaetia bacterium]|nr:ChaN family lipoprotein [Spirochaetia bacterium]
MRIKNIIISSLLFLCFFEFIYAESRKSFWIDLLQYEPVSYEQIVYDLKNVDIIYFGESHRIDRHHDMHKRLLNDLCKNEKRPILLGVEQLEHKFQSDLDNYNGKKITFEKLAKDTNWKKRWGNYEDYKPIFETARTCGMKIIALNAPLEAVREIGRKGLSSLSEDEKKLIAKDIDLSDAAHKKYISLVLQVHAHMTPEKTETVYQAQVTRDETMAENMANEIRNMKTKPLALVIAGSGHVEYGFGVPNRIKRRVPDLKHRIILFSESGDLVLTETEKAQSKSISITHDDLHFLPAPAGNYVHITEQKPD